MKKAILLFIICFPLISFSQKEGQVLIDSLLVELPKMAEDTLKVSILNDLSIAHQSFNTSQGLKYGQNALALAKKLQWNDGMAESYNAIGMNYFSEGNSSETLAYYLKALKTTKNKKINNKTLKSLGAYYASHGDYSKGLDYCFQALKLSEDLKDDENIAKVLSNIGVNYFNLNKNKEAIEYYKKALKLNTKMGVKMSMSKNLRNIGNAYLYLNESDKAIDYFNRALNIDTELGNTAGIAVNLASSSAIYFEMKDYEKAIHYGTQSLQLAKEINRPSIIGINYSNLGGYYLQMAKETSDKVAAKNLLDKALMNSNEALDIYKKTDDISNLYIVYNQLSSIDELNDSYKNALDHYKSAIVYKDSIFNSENKETIKNLEDKREIDLRDRELKINKLTLENRDRQKWYLIFGISLLGIIGFLLLFQSMNRKKVNRKLQILNTELDQSNKIKAQFFGILNHDLRSPVSNLIQFLHLQKDNSDLLNEKNKTKFQNKTIESAENLLTSMEDMLLWSKGQMENFKPQPKNVAINLLFEDTKKHFVSEENVQLSFENKQNIHINTDESYLKTIIRNLTGNAIKAMSTTENPMIIWKAWQEDNITFLSISDNGSGGSQEKFKALYDDNEVVGIKTGLGLHLIRDLAKAIDCKITVASKPNIGTTFTLSLNNYGYTKTTV